MTREEALETLWNGCDRNPKTYQAYYVLSKQRIGHWIERQGNLSKYYTCEECKNDSDFIYNYCPNCGAQMQ